MLMYGGAETLSGGGDVSLVTVRMVATLLPAPFVSVTEIVTGPSARFETSIGMARDPVEPMTSIPFATFGTGSPESVSTTVAIAPTWPVTFTVYVVRLLGIA